MENVLRFEHPEYLYGLIIIPLLIIVYILIHLRQDKIFKRFANVEMRDYLVPQRSGRRNVFKFVVFLDRLQRYLRLQLAHRDFAKASRRGNSGYAD